MSRKVTSILALALAAAGCATSAVQRIDHLASDQGLVVFVIDSEIPQPPVKLVSQDSSRDQIHLPGAQIGVTVLLRAAKAGEYCFDALSQRLLGLPTDAGESGNCVEVDAGMINYGGHIATHFSTSQQVMQTRRLVDEVSFLEIMHRDYAGILAELPLDESDFQIDDAEDF